MNFKHLIMKVRETGKVFILYDGEKFINFDVLYDLIGNEKQYENVNDELMDGIQPWNNGEWTYPICKEQDILHIDFKFVPAN